MGSKAARAGGKLKRLKEKRARKDAMRAQYKKFAEQGRVKGSKRAKKAMKKNISLVSHPCGPCGNPGCKKCFSVNYKPFLNKDGKPENMPQWMWQRYEWKFQYNLWVG